MTDKHHDRPPKTTTTLRSTTTPKAGTTEAIADYEAAIAADPTFLDAMHGLARVYQDTEQFDKAIAVASRITELDPDDVLAHTSLSILYQRKGMVPEAEAEANKARVLGWKQQLKQGKPSAA